jgi:glycerophosphoryl diester phosphodiesterase
MSGFDVPGPNLGALETETNFVRRPAQGADLEFRSFPGRKRRRGGMVSPMLVLAHRGANRLAPENTLPAMAQAVDLGADGVELDVHGTADGALVVRHDADAPSGPIGQLTRDELRTVCPDVPTLAEVLDVCRGTLVNVEVKDPDPRAVDALVTLLAAREDDSSPDDVLVSAFDWTLAERVRAAAPQVPTGLLSFGVPPDEVLVTAVLGGHSAVHPDVWTLLTLDIAGFVTRAHDQDVQVNVWTVNGAAQVEMLRDAGVDAVITDDSDLYRFGVNGGGVRGRRR